MLLHVSPDNITGFHICHKLVNFFYGDLNPEKAKHMINKIGGREKYEAFQKLPDTSR